MGILGGVFSLISGGNNSAKAERQRLDNYRDTLQAQVDAMAIEANNRLRDLEENELNSPAYNQWVKDGKTHFGVKGKTVQQVQSEYWRIKRFLDAKTSTVEGARQVLDNISSIVHFDGATPMTQAQAQTFFRIADRIKDYYKMTGESAKALDYQKIWETLNKMISHNLIDLDKAELDVNEIEQKLIELEIVEQEIEIFKQLELEEELQERAMRQYGGDKSYFPKIKLPSPFTVAKTVFKIARGFLRIFGI